MEKRRQGEQRRRRGQQLQAIPKWLQDAAPKSQVNNVKVDDYDDDDDARLLKFDSPVCDAPPLSSGSGSAFVNVPSKHSFC